MVVCGGQRCEGESRLCQRGAVEHLRAVLGGQGHFLAVDSQRAVVDCHQVVAHSGGCAGRHRHIVNLRDHVLARADIRDVAGVSHHHIEHMVVCGGQRCEGESRLRQLGAVVHFRAVLGSQGHFLAVDGEGAVDGVGACEVVVVGRQTGHHGNDGVVARNGRCGCLRGSAHVGHRAADHR